ncbi:MAG: hypothetical protein WCL11_27020 [Verrucomicrobiota bacterium]
MSLDQLSQSAFEPTQLAGRHPETLSLSKIRMDDPEQRRALAEFCRKRRAEGATQLGRFMRQQATRTK